MIKSFRTLDNYIKHVQSQAGYTLVESQKTRLEVVYRQGYTEDMIRVANEIINAGLPAKESIGQRGAFDDLNKQAQKQTSEELVDSRKALYGTFCGRAELTADLMERLQQHPKWPSIPAWGKWALIMLVEKIGRIVEGDPKYDDNWKDISGYAELARRNATGEKA